MVSSAGIGGLGDPASGPCESCAAQAFLHAEQCAEGCGVKIKVRACTSEPAAISALPLSSPPARHSRRGCGGKRGESAGQSDLRGRLGRRARGISMCRSAWRLTSKVPMTSTQSRIYGRSARARWFSEVPPSFETLETRLKAVYWNCEEATADERFGQRQHQPKLPI